MIIKQRWVGVHPSKGGQHSSSTSSSGRPGMARHSNAVVDERDHGGCLVSKRARLLKNAMMHESRMSLTSDSISGIFSRVVFLLLHLMMHGMMGEPPGS